ncbi:MAG: glycogen synthase GlgA [Bacteroidota bacterium]|jgi:starch synthase|nr:glycogen synthase GlgA [Ignavibacteria bacterium]MCU7497731.1 glycogen synthase GlgA [Ignavibacteria bacterium]MCU7510964.1 glycogen synthase GlgA [Ignavibacteria bacterium]MCU7518817.1 glycogen synthase GlgA [Ignavibacteria bacterium]MCU7523213.1 glycogen synthase GlgA [Ignavibacteria bacterium]
MPPSKKLKILFVTSEVVPFVKTGGLADVSAALPQTLTELGHEVRIVVPKYGAIDERRFKIHEVVRLKDLTLKIGEKDVVFSLRSSFLVGQKARVQIYFLDNYEYFGSRQGLYVDPNTGTDYPDNDERFILLARSIFELINKLGWIPDIIHGNDWQTGLIPAYLKTLYKNDDSLSAVKSIFTVHNLAYQGFFPKSEFSKTGLPEELNSEKGIEIYGRLNFMKSGLMFSDAITTVSERYAEEITKDEELSAGLKSVLTKRKKDLYGIINGIDDKVWNPETDSLIPKKYSAKTLDEKAENKKALTEKFELPYDENVPVIGCISRLVDAKGFDLIAAIIEDLMKMNLQVVLLGTGDRKYHTLFENIHSKYPQKFSCYLGFDDELAHLIEAGSDMFLMPSRYEPCGLNQMYSLMYGTVPVVRETGGLADTVEKYNEKEETGNGFVFKKYDPQDLLKEIKRAVKIFGDKKAWTKIAKSGMKCDFSWTASAKKYVDLYKKILNND